MCNFGSYFASSLLIAACSLMTMTGCQTLNPVIEETTETKTTATTHERLARTGIEFLLKGEFTPASANFNQALKLNPRRAEYHLLNALAYHMQAFDGDATAYDLAEEGYRLAIRFDSSLPLPHYLLGRLLIEKGDFKKAQKSLAEALLLDGKDVDLLKGMACASYHAQDVVTAAAMIDRLEQLKALDSPRDINNAAMIKAASGQREAANTYLARLVATKTGGIQTDKVRRRIEDWSDLHHRIPLQAVEFIETTDTTVPTIPNGPTDLTVPSTPTDPSSGSSSGVTNSLGDSTTAAGATTFSMNSEGQMVVVDVVIIASEETLTSTRGINLLNGLKIQFGATFNTPMGTQLTFPAYADSKYHDTVTNAGTDTSIISDTLISALSIPAISYSLNIANSNTQRNEILARPTIIAETGQTSEFFSGVQLDAAAVAGGTQGGNPVQIQREIGVKLKVTPTVLPDGRIKLAVLAERTFLKTPSSDVNFTFRLETTKTTVNANVVMRYGETLILSGLSEKEAENARDGVPFLEDLPFVQYFFSQRQTKDFQKSVLILLTPRPTQYVYQPESARRAYEQSLPPDQRPIASLRARYSDWFKPYPNWASVFHHMQQNSLYREFRTGDVELERWNNLQSLEHRLQNALGFLWY